jgi:hypothetical protein
MKSPAVAVLLFASCLSGLLAVDIPVERLGFKGATNLIEPAATLGALLLTPEQGNSLESAWLESRQKIAVLRPRGTEATPEAVEQVKAIIRGFAAKCDEVLTPVQRDTVVQLNNVCSAIFKAVDADYQPQVGAAMSQAEKSKILAERNKVFRDGVIEELKNSLPPDRFSAFQAGLK